MVFVQMCKYFVGNSADTKLKYLYEYKQTVCYACVPACVCACVRVCVYVYERMHGYMITFIYVYIIDSAILYIIQKRQG